MSRDAEIALLEARIKRLRNTPEPTYHCAICKESWGDWELTDVTVVVADGDEGYSNVTLLICYSDLGKIVKVLSDLGFIDHRHGTTSTLEDPNCPGFEDMHACPTPTYYGNVTWGRTPPQDPHE